MKKMLFLICKLMICLGVLNGFAQTITYQPPEYFEKDVVAPAVAPVQSGTTIDGGTYREVSVFAGTGSAGGTNTNDPLSSTLNLPSGMVKDALGNYYVTEGISESSKGGQKIRKIAPNGQVTTLMQFNSFVPRDITINTANGDLYFVIHSNRLVRFINNNAQNYPHQDPVYLEYNADRDILVGTSNSGSANGIGTSARLNDPWGIAMAPDNSYVLIADYGNNRLRKVDLTTMEVTNFTNTTFNRVRDVHIVNNDLIYAVDEENLGTIKKITNGGNTVEVLVNSSGHTAGIYDGDGLTGAFMRDPYGITVDGLGNLYVCNFTYATVRKITPEGSVSTVAGRVWELEEANRTGVGFNARFKRPRRVVYDVENGFLLLADTGNHQLKKIQLEGFEILPPLPSGLSFNTATGVISGTPTAISMRDVYHDDFENTLLPAPNATVTLSGDAAVVGDYLKLTNALANKQGGITVVPSTPINHNALKVSFDLITSKESNYSFGPRAADGISYSFAPDADAVTTSPNAEVGTGTKLSLSFSSYHDDNNDKRGIRIFYNPWSNSALGTQVNSVILAYSPNTSWMGRSAKVELEVNNNGQLTLVVDGTVIFNNVQLPADYINSNKSTWKHVIKARTGQYSDLHAIDNLSIQQGYGPTNHTVVGRNHDHVVETTFPLIVTIPPTVSTTSITAVEDTQFTVNYKVLTKGFADLDTSGFVYGTEPNPTVNNNIVINNDSPVAGASYSLGVTGLQGATYYIRALLTDQWGVNAYGEELSVSIPEVTSGAISSITATSAAVSGSVDNNGGLALTARGFCWSTSPNPTISDDVIQDDTTDMGNFNAVITGLTPDTRYYVRAYATNSWGTAYSDELSFVTLPEAPAINYSVSNTLLINTAANIEPSITGGTATQEVAGATNRIFTFPNGVYPRQFALSHDNNYFYYPDDAMNAVYKLDRNTGVVSLIAGGAMGDNDGTGNAAQFRGIFNIAVNRSTGNIYVMDGDSNSEARCRQITPDGVVTTIAGSLGFPNSYLAVDNEGNIFYINSSRAIGMIPCTNNSNNPTFGTPVPDWAGNSASQGNLDGIGSSARFSQINGKIAVDNDNNLYVTDLNLIRKITSGAVVTTIAGNKNSAVIADGIGTEAVFTDFSSFSYNAADHSLYGNDEGLIRKIDLTTAAVETLYNKGMGADYPGWNMEMHNGDIFGLLTSGYITKLTIFGYSITPALPNGLSLDTTGSIVGTPTVLSPLTTYTIQSVNPYHVVRATTQIEVVDASDITVVSSGGSSPAITNGVLTVSGTESVNLSVITNYLNSNTSLTIQATGNIIFNTAIDTAGKDLTIIADADGNNEGAITFNENITAANLTLSGKSAIVKAGKQMVVSGNLVSNTELLLDSESNAFSTLSVTSNISGTGQLTYNRYVNITPSNDLIAAPFAGMSFSNMINNSNSNTLLSGSIGGQSGFYLFGPHNEQSNSYEMYNITTNAATTLTSGKGYRAGSTDGGNLNFTVPADGYNTLSNNVTIGITHTGEGWNLVGNPYPTYLTLSDVYTSNTGNLFGGAYNAFYTYNGDATNPWTIYNGSSGANVKIAPGQAFFVRSAEGGATFSFTPSMQSNTGGDDFIAGRNAAETAVYHAGIELSSSVGIYTTDVYFHPNGSNGLDVGYDAASWQGSAPDYGVYSYLVSDNQGLPIAIQTLHSDALEQDSTVIPLGVEASSGYTLTLGLTDNSYLPESAIVYLEDRNLGSFTNLRTGSYSVSSGNGISGTGRFFIHVGNDATLSNPGEVYSGVQVYSPMGSGVLVVTGVNEPGMRLRLYDIQGRLLLDQGLSAVSMQELPVGTLSTAAVIARLEGAQGSRSVKLIINQK
jgi:hypothetical protein